MADEWDAKARGIVTCPAVPDATSAERMCPFGWNSCRRAAECDLAGDIAAFGREAERRGIERAALVAEDYGNTILIARLFALRIAERIRALAPPMADAGPTEPAGASTGRG